MQASKRGQRVAIFGLVVQLALSMLAVLLWRVTDSPAAQAVLWLVILPLPLWAITVLMFYCQWLQRREAEEIQQLASRPGQAESIFKDEEGETRPASNRLKWMQRYMTPVFTLLLASCHVLIGIFLLRWISNVDVYLPAPGKPASMFFAIGGAFAAFLVSRYAVGMSKTSAWRMLRAPGAYLFTNSLIFALLSGALTAEHYEWPVFGMVVAYILPVFAIIIGVELVLNFVLDLYRPRLPEGEARYSYDSRLLNLIASPESIGHSIAEALNYQFGFEVSSTWFYKLLQRTLVPLLLTGAVIVWLMTSVIVVEEGQQYVVLHWGKPQQVLKPRPYPYLICPWPIDIARKFETDQIHQIILGVGAERAEEFVNGKRVYLWTEEHGRHDELDTLVAKRPSEGKGAETEKEIPSVNLIKLTVGVYYQITDAYKFGYTVTDMPKLLEAIAYREMIRYAASATLLEKLPDDEQGQARPQGIISFGRGKAAKDLHKRIAEAVSAEEGLDLGVKIVRVEIIGSHPPKEAAPAFQEVIAAERRQDLERYQAEADANHMLAAVAGNPELALTLSQAITFERRLTDLESCRREGGDLNKAVKEIIRKTTEQAGSLKEHIELERKLGKLTEDGKTVAQKLLARQENFMSVLKQIQAEPQNLKKIMNEKIVAANNEIENLFVATKGQAAVVVAKARADRWGREFEERARAETFGVQLLCLEAAPVLYPFDIRLDALTKGIGDRQKYVLSVDRDRIEFRINLEEGATSFEEIPLGKE